MTPAEVPSVAVYAGDTLDFPAYTFSHLGVPTNLVAEGWTNWSASWRENIFATAFIALAVDSSQAASGQLGLSATSTQTRAMAGSGTWDVQAQRGLEIRTFLRGTTTFMMDVTRND